MPRYHCACLFKLGLREKQEEETRNRRSRQYFIWIGLLFIEVPKLEVIGNYFIQIFSVRQYVLYQVIHLRFARFPFRTEGSLFKIQLAIVSDSGAQFSKVPKLPKLFGWQFSLYLQKDGAPCYETLQLFSFLFPFQGCKLAPVIGHLSAKFEVLTGKLRSLIGHHDGPLLWRSMVIALKKANFNIWLWWITAKFYFDVCPFRAFVSLNWKHVTAINIHAVRTLEVACTVYWNWFKFKKKRAVTIVLF